MDREIWLTVMAAIHRANKAVSDNGRKPVYPHWLIVAMYLWSVFHDRCLSWACERDHYGSIFRPRKLPSISQFTRRIKTPVCQAILQRVHDELVSCGIASSEGYLDGRQLLVSPVSKDPDAARGRINGGFGKGYKLHAYVNEHRRIVVYAVMPLNVAEQTVAMELCEHLPAPAAPDEAMVIADGNYDSHLLHRKLAQTTGHALLTPLKGRDRTGKQGHHPVTLKQMGPLRRALVSLWKERPQLAKRALKSRNNIEGVFSVMCVALGMSTTLPAFVRGIERVRRWVGAKIILYHARLLTIERLQAATAA